MDTKPQDEVQNLEITHPETDPAAGEILGGKLSGLEQQKTEEGLIKYSRLGWKRLTILLIVEAIALGALSLPAAFATPGLVAGILLNVVIGLISVYTGYLVGQVKVKFPDVLHHYADVGQLLFGKVGYEIFSAMFLLLLVLFGASHCLTGAIAFRNITNNAACSLIFSFLSAVILLALSVPPSFADIVILGYIDFASILLAIGITIIATGVNSARSEHAINWSLWPKQDAGFTDTFVAILNIVFAYGFIICQFSFMDEMHTPNDYMKSIWSLGIIDVFVYSITGALIYAFVGPEVQSPALLSAGPTISKVAFGVALPVIFISGAVMIITAGRFVHGRIYANSITRFVNTRKGWITWILTIAAIVVVGWIIAEAIPFFSDLVALISSMLNSGFTFYFPAYMWFRLLRKGTWNTPKNLCFGALNCLVFLLGIVMLVGGTYAAVKNIVS